MKTLRNVSLIVCLASAAYAEEDVDPVADAPVEDQELDAAAAGCPMTPITHEDRWYCRSTDLVTDSYWRFDNNASFPVFGQGPFSGTITHYNRNYPYKTVSSYSNMRVTRVGGGCLQDVSGATIWQVNIDGVVCELGVNKRQYPESRGFLLTCPNMVNQLWCVEHDGPRAFGGARD